jgi:hypothetical protein
MMTTPPVRVERRAGQRFPYLLPLTLSQNATNLQGAGFTQDLSSRGVFFFTDAPVEEGSEIEITLKMPSEITLGESMRVRCRGRVLRVLKPLASTQDATNPGCPEPKIGVAVRFEGYEYLAEPAETTATFTRLSALHPEPQPLRAEPSRAR